MKNTFSAVYKVLTSEFILYVAVLTLFAGTYYARFLVTSVTAFLALLAILTIVDKDRRVALKSNQATLALTAIFLIYLVSGLYSQNTDLLARRLVTNLPYLFLPVGMWAFGPLTRKVMVNVTSLFIAVTTISALILGADYLLHFDEYNAYYKVGKTIPTPIVHVRYSFFVALAGVLGIGLLADGSLQGRNQKILVWVSTGFLIAVVHILAVRTGIISLYGGIIILTIAMLIRGKNWKLGVSVFGVMALLFVFGIMFLPSMKNKLGYMRYDLEKLRNDGVSPDYSDNIRLTSIRHGLRIFADHPLFGVGIGDVQDEMNRKYEEYTPNVPVESRFFPISQFVFWLVAFGGVGTLILLSLLLSPLLSPGMRAYVVVGLYSVFLFSFFAETTVQLQYGKTIFLVLVSTFLQHYGRRDMIVEPILAPHN